MTLDAFPEAHVNQHLDPDTRYTTSDTMTLCMKLAGVAIWDLDVAANEECHWALKYYDIQQNGLRQPWNGRVWCNPPWSDIQPWVEKAWTESKYCPVIAMLLPSNRTEQPWWQRLVEPLRDKPTPKLKVNLRSYFLPGRPKYGHPGNVQGVGVGSPYFGSTLLIWRSKS